MKHLNEKLQKIELLISDDCPDKTKELIQEYWDHDSNYKFSEIPSQIRFKYRLKQKELNATINKFSKLILHIYCGTCKKTEPLPITSQTGFTDTIYHLKRKNPHKCEQCKTNEAEQRQNRIVSEQDEKQKAQREMVMQLIKDSNKAIDAKAWNNLSEFENTVLKHAIQLDSIVELKRYYYGQGSQSYKMLFTVLRLLEAEKLLFLDVDLDDKNIIKNYGFLDRLKDEYEYVKTQITIEDKVSNVASEKETNELNLKLTSNIDDENPNNPQYTSLFTVKEKVTLKPGDEFVCHLYHSENGEMYLKIASLESIKKLPAQIALHLLPIELRIQIEDYLKANPRLNK
ncbi:hypothetical protein [Gelidibacter pelagius]|uniref:WYL domain-containing protein n=1 Tax=Gelidibacter pelagius TaxID=2819985 RepID=A0ABS3SQJ2_9FLAO|nr:hypothetical protein [Gelidibacter pelagius]MBO3097611.1 hypothetical protein [Gelidibacter pelagius]